MIRSAVVAITLTLGLFACGEVSDTTPDAEISIDAQVTVVSIAVTPDSATVRTGERVQLSATATYSDSTSADVTASVTWSDTPLGGSASVTGGLVLAQAAGDVRISAALGGQSDSAVITVVQPMLVVTNFLNANVKVYPTNANGDIAATRTIEGAATTLVYPRGVWVLNNEIIVVDQAANSITFFELTANGDVAPARRIVGPATQLVGPVGIYVHENEMYIPQQNNTVVVFPTTASGDVVPTRIITGLSIPHYLAVLDDELYITNHGDGSIAVLPVTANGAAVPTRTITGLQVGLTDPTGIVIHGNELFVTDTRTGTDEIRVFPVTANGDVAPTRVIAGANTGLGYPDQLFIFQDELYVSNYDTDSLRVFPLTANGDATPTRSIVGPATGFNGTLGVFVY